MRTKRLSRVFLLLFFVLGQFRFVSGASAGTTILVDTFLDDLENNGNCSLREAVIAANTDAARDACPQGSADDTIQLQAGLYSFTVTGRGEDTALQGDLDLTASLIIQGAGMGSTVIDAGALDRVFQVFSPAQVIINDLTIRNGDTSAGLGPVYSGGGISLISGSTVTLNRVHLDSNHAGDSGGAIYNNAGTTTLDHVILSGNNAEWYGGAVRSLGVLNISNTTVAGNHSTRAGGGIHSSFQLNLESSLLSANTAATNGGGLYLSLGTAVLSNVTISGNTATATQGGGIWVYYQTELTLTNATITGNYAGQGGGIYNNHQQALALNLYNSVYATPQAVGNIHLKNTIVAGNTLANCGRSDQTEPIDSLGHNLDSAVSCEFIPAKGDLVSTDPLLGVLLDNGGFSETHALSSGSPAINAGDNTGCPAADQRGLARPQTATCDIGAYEALETGQADLAMSKLANPDPVLASQPLSYTLQISNAGPDPAALVSVRDELPSGVVFQSAVGMGWACTYANGMVHCTRQDLGVEAAPSIVIYTRAPEIAGVITNSAAVTSVVHDPNLGNETPSVNSSVNPIYWISLPLILTSP